MKLLKFMKKHNLFFKHNAIWHYDPNKKASTIVFPTHHNFRVWYKKPHCKNSELKNKSLGIHEHSTKSTDTV